MTFSRILAVILFTVVGKCTENMNIFKMKCGRCHFVYYITFKLIYM